jgi:ribonuclease VapC
MVIDTSAILSFLRGGPHADAIETVLAERSTLRMSATAVFATRALLLRRFGDIAVGEFDQVLIHARIIVEPFDRDQAGRAFEAWRRFGRGSDHPAQLTFTQCASYALARFRDVPLLFVDERLALTDVRPALGRP